MLANFTLVNAALVRLKLKQVPAPAEATVVPLWIPIVGCLLCLAFLGVQLLGPPAK